MLQQIAAGWELHFFMLLLYFLPRVHYIGCYYIVIECIHSQLSKPEEKI